FRRLACRAIALYVEGRCGPGVSQFSDGSASRICVRMLDCDVVARILQAKPFAKQQLRAFAVVGRVVDQLIDLTKGRKIVERSESELVHELCCGSIQQWATNTICAPGNFDESELEQAAQRVVAVNPSYIVQLWL